MYKASDVKLTIAGKEIEGYSTNAHVVNKTGYINTFKMVIPFDSHTAANYFVKKVTNERTILTFGKNNYQVLGVDEMEFYSRSEVVVVLLITSFL